MREKRSGSKAFIFLFAGCLLLFAAIFPGRGIYEKAADSLGAVSFQKGTITIQPGQTGFTSEDIKTLQKGLKTNTFCYSGSMESRAFSGSNSARAVITGTTELAPMFGDIRIKKGSFFSKADNAEGSRVAVIEDKLAWDLFHNDNVLGCNIEISGIAFQIIGVADSDRSLFGKLSDDLPPQAYIPAGVFPELGPEAVISCFQYRTATNGTYAGNSGDMSRAISSAGFDPSLFRVSDFPVRGAIMLQKTEIPVFLMGGFLLLSLWTWILRQSGGTIRAIRSECRQDYFLSALHTLRPKIGKNLLLILLAGLCSFLVWRLIRFSLYIPPELIPDDFTDLSYYTRMLWRNIGQSMLNGGDAGTLPSNPELRISAMETVQNWIVYAGGLTGILFYITGLILAGKEEIPADRLIAGCGIFLAAAAVVLPFLAYAAGLPFGLDTRALAVFWGFLFVSLMKSSPAKQVQPVEINQFYESEEHRHV